MEKSEIMSELDSIIEGLESVSAKDSSYKILDIIVRLHIIKGMLEINQKYNQGVKSWEK